MTLVSAQPNPIARLLDARGPRATLLVRLMVGIVFASEGIQKFLYPEALGAGRFAQIGIPSPALMAPFVGAVEIVCGVLILIGLVTRFAALPLIIDMIVAVASTKVPILMGHGYLWFANPPGNKTGLWTMLHEARTDLSMLLGSLFLLIVGAGEWSVDRTTFKSKHWSTKSSLGSGRSMLSIRPS